MLNTSYTITAEVEIPQGGAEGMIHTNGGRFGGYGFYLLKNKPVFTWNLLNVRRERWEGPELAPGKHAIEFDFKYDGGLRDTGIQQPERHRPQRHRRAQGRRPASDHAQDGAHGAADPAKGRGLRHRCGHRYALDDKDYQVPFALTAKLNKLTIKLDRPKLTPADEKKLMEAQEKASDRR